ncbi:MAG: metallophosphoesterase [Spirosomataceae bacterium]
MPGFRNTFLLTYLLLIAASVTHAQKITRGPYLQTGTPTGLTVRWRTDAATIGKVTYGTATNQKTQSVTEDVPTTDHELKIIGLTPNTVYYYGIQSSPDGSVAEGNDYYFKTAAPAGSKQKIRIWAMGDMGDGSPNQRAVRDAYLQRIKNDNRQTDVMLLLGDNAYAIGTDEEYQNNFFNIYQDHFLKNNVLWAVPGNHEYYSGSRTSRDISYFKIFSFPQNAEAGGVPSGTEMYYSFDYANVHFVALDSDGIEENQYRLYDTLGPQVKWLKKDLAANRQPWTIVFFHHPPYTKNSHDSDSEEELKLIRQNLTPILERYKVDLVLSGHSHLYERSRPMHGHTDVSTTFRDDQHLASLSSGRYDGEPNSCAYIKNGGDEGVIYVVAGSGGQNNGYNGVAHPAMPFKNAVNGGSVVIEVEDNRLNFEWLCNDRIVRDQFTIFKNVNKITPLKARHGETVKLMPSWKGTYLWPNGSRQPPFEFTLTNDTTIVVRDSLGCLEDRFRVELAAKPVIVTEKLPATVCAGDKLNLPFTVANTDAGKWRYRVQLSDAKGDFTKAITLAEGGAGSLTVTVPENSETGDGYRVRILANVNGIDQGVSAAFPIRRKPSANLSGEATIEAGKPTNLVVTFSGSAPWTYRLSDNSSATTSVNPLTISVTPLVSTAYVLNSVNNTCGEGEVRGSARIAVIPRITANLSLSQVVCNDTPFDLPFSVTGVFENPVTYEAQLSDKDGNFTDPRLIGTATQSPIKTTIPNDVALEGNYRIRVYPSQNGTAYFTPTPSFSLKQRAKATISGDTIIQLGESALLKLRFEGQSPWTYTLSDNSSNTVSSALHTIVVKPDLLTTYTLKSISNVCGAGVVSGSVRVNVIVTGIEEEEESVRVFPNPAQTKLSVEIKALQNLSFDWELTDASGKMVRKGNLKKSRRNHVDIDLIDLPVGVYALRMISEGRETITRKIIKQ